MVGKYDLYIIILTDFRGLLGVGMEKAVHTAIHLTNGF